MVGWGLRDELGKGPPKRSMVVSPIWGNFYEKTSKHFAPLVPRKVGFGAIRSEIMNFAISLPNLPKYLPFVGGIVL